MFRNDGCLAQCAILTTLNERLQDLTNGIRSMVSETSLLFLSADSADEAEINKLNYPVKLLNPIAGTVSLLDHMLTL